MGRVNPAVQLAPERDRPGRPNAGRRSTPDITSLSMKEIRSAFRAVNNLLNDYGAILPESLDISLREFRSQLTEKLSPYSVAQLDAHVKSLNEQFPDYEH